MKAWLAGLALFAALSTAAQAELISGTVFDAVTKRPLPGASVVMTMPSDAPALRTYTDALGRFSVETDVIPTDIVVSARYYETMTGATTVIARSGFTGLVLALPPRLINISMHDRFPPVPSACAAFQPRQTTDRYTLISGRCGVKF